MTSTFFKSFYRLLTPTLGVMALCGCGMGTGAPSAPQPLNALGGRAMGGEQPITSATVTLMETQSNGKQLGNPTVTDSNGYFNLSDTNGGSAPVLSCDAGQQVYVVIAGGSPDGGAHTNDSILQAATLGSCGSTLSFTVANEITTVATAYALGNFATITGSGSGALIQISAPANNNSVATSNNVTSGTTSTASGLLHAFKNAVNLVDMTNGFAYTATPAGNGAVPQAFINTVADILQTCVNSDGSTDADTNCAKLFAATPDRSGTLPANVFQAAINLAKNPYVSAANVAALYNLLPGQLAFSPALAAAPHDWTLAISYQTPPDHHSPDGKSVPFMVALDADDNVYIATSPQDATGSTTQTSACILFFTSNGTQRGSGFSCDALPNQSAYTAIAPDALGNLWVNNYSSQPGAAGILRIASFNGDYIGDYNGFGMMRSATLAVNKNNDVYVGVNSTLGSNFRYFANNSGTWTLTTVTGIPHFSAAIHGVAIDSGQNAWGAETGSTSSTMGGAVGFFPYNSSATPPFDNTALPIVETAIAGGTVTGATNNSAPVGIAIDGSGNAWVTNNGAGTSTSPIQLTKLTPNGTSAPTVATSVTTGLNQPQQPEVDGDGVVWVPDTAGVHAYNPSTSSFISQTANTGTGSSAFGGFEPCYLGYQGTTTSGCNQSWSTSIRNVAIDATGSVWYLYPDSSSNALGLATGRAFQIIGTASPTWPLLAQGQPGVKPQ